MVFAIPQSGNRVMYIYFSLVGVPPTRIIIKVDLSTHHNFSYIPVNKINSSTHDEENTQCLHLGPGNLA